MAKFFSLANFSILFIFDGKIYLFNSRLISFFSFKIVSNSKISLFFTYFSYISYLTNKKQKLILFNSQKKPISLPNIG